MKRVRYSVAMSLDGYIAGPKGESDWIVMDPDIDFQSIEECPFFPVSSTSIITDCRMVDSTDIGFSICNPGK